MNSSPAGMRRNFPLLSASTGPTESALPPNGALRGDKGLASQKGYKRKSLR